MEKHINSYETLFVIDAQLSEDEIKTLTEKFTGMIAANSSVSEVNEWGKRRLAYPINYKTEGYYVLVNHMSEGEFPAELDRVFGITEGILRHMTIRHEEKSEGADAAAPVVAEETAAAEE